MTGNPDETYLESYIERYLTSQPIATIRGDRLSRMEYRSIDADAYDKERAIIPDELIGFLKDTQPEEYKKMVDNAKGDEAAVRKSILDRITSELRHGTLHLLRRDAEEHPFHAGLGGVFRLVYFRPASGMNTEHERLYNLNRLAIVRQLHYSTNKKRAGDSIDTVIFVNGLPVFTIELKNTLTGQTHINAIQQYMRDRQVAGERLLEFKRCLAHFAVGTEEVYVTTCLAGQDTRFVPFNDGYRNANIKNRNEFNGYLISYLWEDVLRRDSLLDLIDQYIFVKEESEKVYDATTRRLREDTHERLLFPRFHQRRAVEKLVDDVRERGAGHRYLIQHSAGSGKSNTIAWLAFKLAYLYPTPEATVPLFHSVIVVTDRRALDRQTQRTFAQLAQDENELAMVAENQNSQNLKGYIENGARIIVTTLQKFSEIADEVTIFPNRRYAVIIDEAHSSQTGEGARDMRKSLSLSEAEAFDRELEEAADPVPTLNAIITREMQRKGQQSHISFFAFTATPKQKTLPLFAEMVNGVRKPFDVYTTEEAISEGFILNVLDNYLSFKRYYRLARRTDIPDKEYSRKKAIRLLNSYVDLQDTAFERKSRVMLEHFVAETADQIQGQARAMLVTRSRLHAVRFKRKFDEIMQEMRLPYGALVAFTGSVHDDETGEDYTEASMNHLPGRTSIPDALKMPQWRILIVANKYQTGFDEPLLHTMFVDKKLGGTATVQTLSRLNRTMKGKDSTMVLDFVNEPEQIRQDCQDYYGMNYMLAEDDTDPNVLYDLMTTIDRFNVFSHKDIDDYATYFMDSNGKERIYGVVNRVCHRIDTQLTDEQKDDFRRRCRQYVNTYKFLCQILTFADPELEKLYIFLAAIVKAMPFEHDHIPYDVLHEAQLTDYKIQFQYKAELQLESGDKSMSGLSSDHSSGEAEEDFDLLSRIIQTLNDTYGLNLTEEDRVDMERMRERLYANEQLMSFFNPDNTRDDVRDRFDEEVDNELLDFINTKLELYNKLTDDRANAVFKRMWFDQLYDQRVRGFSHA